MHYKLNKMNYDCEQKSKFILFYKIFISFFFQSISHAIIDLLNFLCKCKSGSIFFEMSLISISISSYFTFDAI